MVGHTRVDHDGWGIIGGILACQLDEGNCRGASSMI